MRQALKLHADSRCSAVSRLEVDVARPRPGALVLRYVVTGNLSELRMPPVTAPVPSRRRSRRFGDAGARADELWQHTCFEAFVRASPGGAYYEFNFAPSTLWAAYRFEGHRSGMSVAREIGAPSIGVQSTPKCYELHAALELDRVPGLPNDGAWRLGLAAVIEEMDGNRSYWALAHAPGKADFHHADCFALELAAPSRA